MKFHQISAFFLEPVTFLQIPSFFLMTYFQRDKQQQIKDDDEQTNKQTNEQKLLKDDSFSEHIYMGSIILAKNSLSFEN